MACYLFNVSDSGATDGRPARERAAELLRAGVWGVDPDTPHFDALSPGDLVLLYVAAPDRVFIGRAELASDVPDVTSAETHARGGDLRNRVLLSNVEAWAPPVPMEDVLARIGPGSNAKADFTADVVRITPHEYESAVAVAAEPGRRRPAPPG